VYGTFRVPFVALVALALVFAGATQAASGQGPRSSAGRGSPAEPTRAHALEVLARAKSQLSENTERLRSHRRVGRGPGTDITMTLRDLAFARSALTGPSRREADALLSRPPDPGGDELGTPDPAVVYPLRGRRSWCPPNGVACVHWVTAGAERVNLTDSDADALPDYVETVYATVAQVWSYQTGAMGYRKPLPDGGTPTDAANPSARIDIYLADLGGRDLYGYCVPEGSPTARQLPGYCVLDNDYSRKQYRIAPIDALRATAAHEFFHAIQFGYDVAEDIWFMEGTATWIEDEVYDSINDNVQYLPTSAIRFPRRPADLSVESHRYGSFLLFKYASERLGRNVVRQFWEHSDASRGRYSLQAIRSVLAARGTSWPAFFAVFASWNSLPALSYTEGGRYPAPVFTLSRTLTRRATTTGWRTVSLPHLSSSSIRVVPHPRLSRRKNLLVEVDAPDTARGAAALVQHRYRSGAVAHSVMALNRAGKGRLLVRFDRRVLASLVVVTSNTSTAMRDCGRVEDGYGGPVYSCYGRGYYDSGQAFGVRASVR
jgi:hypothetical protein